MEIATFFVCLLQKKEPKIEQKSRIPDEKEYKKHIVVIKKYLIFKKKCFVKVLRGIPFATTIKLRFILIVGSGHRQKINVGKLGGLLGVIHAAVELRLLN